jgi:hypothetical protein
MAQAKGEDTSWDIDNARRREDALYNGEGIVWERLEGIVVDRI